MDSDWLGTLEEQEEFEELTQSYVEQQAPVVEDGRQDGHLEQVLEFTENEEFEELTQEFLESVEDGAEHQSHPLEQEDRDASWLGSEGEQAEYADLTLSLLDIQVSERPPTLVESSEEQEDGCEDDIWGSLEDQEDWVNMTQSWIEVPDSSLCHL